MKTGGVWKVILRGRVGTGTVMGLRICLMVCILRQNVPSYSLSLIRARFVVICF